MLHGNRTYLLMNDDGQINEAHSISAGLDYPGIGPEHSWLHDIGRVKYLSATDEEALDAFQLCCRLEGIIPALEPAHALAKVLELAPKKPKDHLMVMNLCGRGDKDIFTVAEHLGGTPVISRQKVVGWIADHRVDGLHLVLFARAAVQCRSRSGEEGMGAFHRLDRDIDARHHQRPHGRDARAPTQGSARVKIEPSELHFS